MNDAQDRRGRARRILRIALTALAVALLAAGVLVLFRSLVNRLFLYSYDNGSYSRFPESLGRPLAFGDNYVVPYNLGNAAYQLGNYREAEDCFADALRRHPPAEEVECKVRINLALSKLHAYDFDGMDKGDERQVEEALQVLRSARAVLTESGCANEKAGVYDGHSEEAEKLKRDIDAMIDKLSNPPPPPEGGAGGGSGGGGDQPEDQDQDQDPGGGKQEDEPKSGGGAGRQERQERQKELRDQLTEQKQDLDAGNYAGSGGRDFTYIETGDSFGFGEGAPW